SHSLVLGAPQSEQAVGIMGCHPVAQKPCRDRDDAFAAIDAVQPHRSQPRAISGLPDLVLKPSYDPRPFAGLGENGVLNLIAPSCFRHPRSPLSTCMLCRISKE